MSAHWLFLSTPYSKYPRGIEAAFHMACEARAIFVREKIPVFSPIVHSHPVAVMCGLDPLDHSIWLPDNTPMLDTAGALIVWQAESWKQSYGIKVEIEHFTKARKPVIHCHPEAPCLEDIRKVWRELLAKRVA